MKTTIGNLMLILALGVTLPAFSLAAEKKKAGPNGGRVVRAIDPPVEFFVTKDRKVEITALTPELKAAKLSGQVITVTAGDRSKPTKMELKDEDGKLVSMNSLPDGNDFPVSISLKANAGAKAVYEKFNLDLDKCPTCEYPEYACVCAHAGKEKDEKK